MDEQQVHPPDIDDLYDEMRRAGEMAYSGGGSTGHWHWEDDRLLAEDSMRRMIANPRTKNYIVIAYGPRNDLGWLYHTPTGDGEGAGEEAMREFMKEQGKLMDATTP